MREKGNGNDYFAIGMMHYNPIIVALLNNSNKYMFKDELDAVGVLVNLTISPVVKVMGAYTKLVLHADGRVTLGLGKGTAEVAAAFIMGSARSLEGNLYTVSIPFLPNIVAAGETLVKNIKGIKRFVMAKESCSRMQKGAM